MCKLCDLKENEYDSIEDLEICNKITIIPYLPNLEELYCNNTKIESIPYLPNLEWLSCNNTKIESIPNPPNLRALSCDNCPIIKIGHKLSYNQFLLYKEKLNISIIKLSNKMREYDLFEKGLVKIVLEYESYKHF